jgi:quercetin dioxygenase-like cupin family protein
MIMFLAGLAAAQTSGQIMEKKTQTPGGAPEAAATIPSPSGEVSYLDKSKVDAAFAKGGVLLDGSNGSNYLILAGRRERPGQAEVHGKDTDIIYVLEGAATFATGGEAVDAKATAPDEFRGPSIRNGQTRQLAKGDVIVVPHGVPHQFTETTNPFLYFVVKVR